MKNIIYLDNGATTKPDVKAIEYASAFITDNYFNPSATYHEGIQVANELKSAKETFKKVIGDNFEILFTSCGTESDNTAVFSYSKRGNIVTTLAEHSAIHAPFTHLKNQGLDVRFAKINEDGSVNIDSLLSLIDKNTTFVSVIHVNNETGAINDINKIAKLIKQINPSVIFHSDGVQAFMKIPYALSNDIDLYSVSAHKINALKGTGALFINKRIKNLKPLILGGGQENGLRSGTENVYGIKVFEYATKKHYETLVSDYNKVKQLKQLLLSNLNYDIFKVISSNNASPYVISLSAVGLKGEVLMHSLEEDGIIIGTGSACSSKNRHSRALKEAGHDENVLDGVIRISFSYETTEEEVKYLIEKLNLRAENLKRTIYKLQ